MQTSSYKYVGPPRDTAGVPAKFKNNDLMPKEIAYIWFFPDQTTLHMTRKEWLDNFKYVDNSYQYATKAYAPPDPAMEKVRCSFFHKESDGLTHTSYLPESELPLWIRTYILLHGV